jgi:hypothetical protein
MQRTPSAPLMRKPLGALAARRDNVAAYTQNYHCPFRLGCGVYAAKRYYFIAYRNTASIAVTSNIIIASAIRDNHDDNDDSGSDGLYESACTYATTAYVHIYAENCCAFGHPNAVSRVAHCSVNWLEDIQERFFRAELSISIGVVWS